MQSDHRSDEPATRIASLTEQTVKTASIRLSKEWEEAMANEKALCLDHVEVVCRAFCDVIAPRDSEDLMQADFSVEGAYHQDYEPGESKTEFSHVPPKECLPHYHPTEIQI